MKHLLSVLSKAPDFKNKLLTNRYKHFWLSQFINMLNSLSMKRESSINVIQIIHSDKDYCSFGKTYNQEGVKFTIFDLLFSSIELIIWASWLLVFMKIWKYLTIVLRWPSITSVDARNGLIHALSFVIFYTFTLFKFFKCTSLLITFVNTYFCALWIRVIFLWNKLAILIKYGILTSKKQEHPLNCCTVKHFCNLCWRWWRIYSWNCLLINRIEQHHRIIKKAYI